MENLNAKRIKSDLEHCKFGKDKPNCEGCNYKPWIKPRCFGLLCSDALALINSQEQRIKELTEENERLSYLEKKVICGYKEGYSKAVIAMRETLRQRFGTDKDRVYSNYNIARYIDQIAKEMLEGR